MVAVPLYINSGSGRPEVLWSSKERCQCDGGTRVIRIVQLVRDVLFGMSGKRRELRFDLLTSA